jgi:menaquinone-dependent protoporphyrinogen oxidase
MATMPRVVVTYATATGSTAGIAERIATALRAGGCEVDCDPAGPAVDLEGADAVVVGSAIHDMAWLPPALDVLHRLTAIQHGSVWCFSVGAVTPRGRFTRFLAAQEAVRVAQGFPAGFHARQHEVFGGVVRMHGVPLWGRLFYRLAGARPGDHRDWAAIERWAACVAAALREAPAPPPRSAGPVRDTAGAEACPTRGRAQGDCRST